MPTTIRPFGGVRSHSVEFTVIVAVALPPAGMDAVGVPVTEIAGVKALKWPTSLGALSSPVLKRSKPATVKLKRGCVAAERPMSARKTGAMTVLLSVGAGARNAFGPTVPVATLK